MKLNKLKNKLFFATGLALTISLSPANTLLQDFGTHTQVCINAASTKSVSDEDTLRKYCESGDTYTLKITKGFNVSKTIKVKGNITLLADGAGRNIGAKEEITKVFCVDSGTLTLGDNNANSPNITIIGGKKDGTAMTLYTIVVENGGKLIMNESSCIKTSKTQGVQIKSNSVFTMNGGTIKGFNSTAGGGAVAILSGATFNLKNGNICSNAVGGVYCKGEFNMTGGNIYSNSTGAWNPAIDKSTGYGGGIYVDSNACTISGGKIYNNNAGVSNECGDGIYVAAGKTLYVSDNAYIDPNNVIALGSETSKICIKNTLSSEYKPALTIHPFTYTSGTVIAQGYNSDMDISSYTNFFALDNPGAYIIRPKASDKSQIIMSEELSVSYNLEKGEENANIPSSQKAFYGDAYTIISETPTRIGYEFDGWFTSPNGQGKKYTSGTRLLLTDNLTLYANWKPITYRMVLYANGGNGGITGTGGKYERTFYYENGFKLEFNNIPTRTGMTFIGWSDNKDYASNRQGTLYTATYYAERTLKMASDVYLYAVWEDIPVVITYETNGDSIINPTNGTVLKNPSVTTFIPLKEGYTFNGWWDTRDNSGKRYSSGQNCSTSITLYAHWLKKGNWTFDMTSSDSEIFIDNAENNTTYTTKVNKKLSLQLNANYSGEVEGDNTIRYWYQIVCKGFDYKDTAWRTMENGKVTINNDLYNFRIFFKVSCGENIAITKTNGFSMDTTAPTIMGVKNGKTYKKSVTIRVDDLMSGIKSIKLNGKKISSRYKVSKNGSYRLVVVDNFGNKKVIKFKIKKKKSN